MLFALSRPAEPRAIQVDQVGRIHRVLWNYLAAETVAQIFQDRPEFLPPKIVFPGIARAIPIESLGFVEFPNLGKLPRATTNHAERSAIRKTPSVDDARIGIDH